MARASGEHIAILLPSLAGGGAERVHILLAEEFVRAGRRVSFILRQRRGELLADVPNEAEVISLDCRRVRQVPLRLLGCLRRLRPDALLIAMWPLTGIAAAATGTMRRPPRLVLSEHTDFRLARAFKPAERAVLARFGRLIYARADAVVAVSDGVAESMCEAAGLSRESITVIHNPIRLPKAAPVDPADMPLVDWWRAGEGRIVSLGSLKPAKAYGDLIEALAVLRRSGDHRLVIVGEGPDRPALEARIRELGITDGVRLVGYRSDPYPLLSEAEVFAMSSHWEGFGNVLVEALAVGLKVVSTDCRSGPREILEDGRYGRLVPVGEPVVMARAIATSLAEQADPVRLRARAETFAPATAASRYLSLLAPRS